MVGNSEFGSGFGSGDGFGFGDEFGSGSGSGDGDGFGDGNGFGPGRWFGFGDGHKRGDRLPETPGDHIAAYCQTWQVLRIGCEVHELSDWIANAEEIDSKHGDGIADQTLALALSLRDGTHPTFSAPPKEITT